MEGGGGEGGTGGYINNQKATTLGVIEHSLLLARRWVIYCPLPTSTEKMQERGPTVYCTYARRPECIAIYGCHSKGIIFSSVIFLSYFKTMSVGLLWNLNHSPPTWQSSTLQAWKLLRVKAHVEQVM